MTSKSALVSSCKAMLSICGLVSCLLGQAPPSQQGFETPQAAADALIHAAEVYDVAALKAILGPDSDDVIASADPVADKNRGAAFAAKARERKSVRVDPLQPKTATLSVGGEDWPLPIPIVLRRGKWYFDTKSGREELLRRRIGANELDAMTICRGFVDAQIQYAMDRHGNSGPNQYAQRIISAPGKQDGLYWQNDDGTSGGPISKAVARAIEEGYSPSKSSPFHGYHFKILKGQGPSAQLGRLDFVINGAMIGGFALVAAPAEYRVTGVKTFIVSHQGVVYQKDLGTDSLKIFQKMDRFDPDKTWRRTDDGW